MVTSIASHPFGARNEEQDCKVKEQSLDVATILFLMYHRRAGSKRADMVTLDFEKGNGLVPAIAQDYKSGRVLMVAYMNNEAWERTLQTGEAHYWSRSRGEIWHKGATSGNIQIVKEIFADCDRDAILLKVEQVGGAACHLGYESCFHNRVDSNGTITIIDEKIFNPAQVYGK
jgi:phosphoribosyl-AMP cyclohydrolase